MTTQDKITNILLFARHLLNTQDVTLRVQTMTDDASPFWSVWVEHQGFKLHGMTTAVAPGSLEMAIDALLETLTTKVHTQMEQAAQLLKDVT